MPLNLLWHKEGLKYKSFLFNAMKKCIAILMLVCGVSCALPSIGDHVSVYTQPETLSAMYMYDGTIYDIDNGFMGIDCVFSTVLGKNTSSTTERNGLMWINLETIKRIDLNETSIPN